VWAVQLRRHHAWFAHDLTNCIKAANENPALPILSVNVFVTKETVAAPGDAAVSGRSVMELHAGRPKLSPALAAAVTNNTGPTAGVYVLACGPAGFVRQAWDAVTALRSTHRGTVAFDRKSFTL